MRGAGREIGVVQVIGLHPRLDEGAHQRLQRVGVVVDALQQHALADQSRAGVDQPPAGGARLVRQLARMVGVQRDIDRLVVAVAERAGHRLGHPLRRGDRQAGVPAQHLDMRDRRQRRSSSRRGGAATGRADRRRSAPPPRSADAPGCSRARRRSPPRSAPARRGRPFRGGSRSGNRPRRPRRA